MIVYSIAMQIVSALIVLVSSGWIFNAALDIWIPRYKHYSEIKLFASQNQYRDSLHSEKEQKKIEHLNSSDLERYLTQKKQDRLSEFRNRGVEACFGILPWLLVGLISLAIHWHLSRRLSDSRSKS